MACLRDDLEPCIRQLRRERLGEREVHPVAFAAGDDSWRADPTRVNDAARGLPHQARDLGRSQRSDLLQRCLAMRLGKLGDELAMQKAPRENPCGECEAARPPPETCRKTVERRTDDEPANVHSPRHPEGEQTTEGQPAHVVPGLHALHSLLDGGLEAAAVSGNQIRSQRSVAESLELRLPSAGAGSEPVQQDQRQETGSDSVIQMLPSAH
jgi:hypothetical protein